MNKKGVYRNKKLLRLARLSPCQRCGLAEGGDNVVACHIQSFRSAAFGKGMGIKPADFAVAYLCNWCHDLMDRRSNELSKQGVNSEEHSEMWLLYIVKTYGWLLENGHLEVVGRVD